MSDEDLVEPEGTNAGSDAATDEREHPPGDVRGGGHPEQAPPAETPPGRAGDEDGEMAGAPGTEPTDAGQEAASAAQDSGSSD